MALGAHPGDILGWVARLGFKLISIGIVVGVALALGLTPYGPKTLPGSCPEQDRIGAGGQQREVCETSITIKVTEATSEDVHHGSISLFLGALTLRCGSSSACRPGAGVAGLFH
jgi:hypothetical protein